MKKPLTYISLFSSAGVGCFGFKLNGFECIVQEARFGGIVMKLAFISDYYHPSIGGTQMLCKNISEFFHENDHEIESIVSSTRRSANNVFFIIIQVLTFGLHFLQQSFVEAIHLLRVSIFAPFRAI